MIRGVLNFPIDFKWVIRQRFKWDEWDSLKTIYDYHSIMHYHSFSYAAGKMPTIVPQEQGIFIGQRCGLSETDVEQAILLYKCDKTKFPTSECRMYKPNPNGQC